MLSRIFFLVNERNVAGFYTDYLRLWSFPFHTDRALLIEF